MTRDRLRVPAASRPGVLDWRRPGPLLAALGTVVLMTSCVETCQPVPVPPSPSYGGSPPVAVGGSGGWENPWTGGAGGKAPASPCETYCSKLLRMACPEAADQTSCIAQCSRILAAPDLATLDLDAGHCSTRKP
jgi:hypothetical protein